MAGMVYTRARARAPHALYIYIDPNNNNNNPYILTPTHYTYWALRGVSLMRMRDTPRHAKSQGLAVTIGLEITVIFVTFSHPLAAHSQFHHRIYHP